MVHGQSPADEADVEVVEIAVNNTPNTGFIAALMPALRAVAAPEKAAGMKSYMKSSMPYLGVPVPIVRRTVRSLAREYPFGSSDGTAVDGTPDTVAQLRSTAEVLWRSAQFREQRYASAAITALKPAKGRLEFLPLYQEMIATGAWWDHVDEVTHRVCDLLQNHRATVEPVIRGWSISGDLWFRRSAILSQLDAKRATDTVLLTDVIAANMGDKEFFVRKAIGWSLRQYARTDAEWVRSFVHRNQERLSPLSCREALKHIS